MEKWAKVLNRHFPKEDIQRVTSTEKKITIIHLERNANANYSEGPPHTCLNSYYY